MEMRTPFELLKLTEQKYRKRSVTPIDRSSVGQEWTGVLFRLGKLKLLAPMSTVMEIVPMEENTPVPGVQPWVLGLVNLHGNLVTVIDLEGYLYGENIDATMEDAKLLVATNRRYQVGLVVREVFGMKHFWQADAAELDVSLDPKVQRYVQTAFSRHGEHYAVFELERLLADRNFQHLSK